MILIISGRSCYWKKHSVKYVSRSWSTCHWCGCHGQEDCGAWQSCLEGNQGWVWPVCLPWQWRTQQSSAKNYHLWGRFSNMRFWLLINCLLRMKNKDRSWIESPILRFTKKCGGRQWSVQPLGTSTSSWTSPSCSRPVWWSPTCTRSSWSPARRTSSSSGWWNKDTCLRETPSWWLGRRWTLIRRPPWLSLSLRTADLYMIHQNK